MHKYFRFVKDISIFALLNLFSVVQGLIFLPIITKILGAEDFGIWSQLKNTMGLLVPFTFLGMQEAAMRFLPGAKSKDELKEGVYSSLVLVCGVTIIVALVLVIFSTPISLLLRFDPIFVRLLSLIVIFESLNSILLVVVQAIREIGKYFWLVSLKMIFETGLIIGAITMGYGLYGAVFAFLLIRVITFLVLLGFMFLKIGPRVPDFSLLRKYLAFGLPTITNNISYWVVTVADRYFIGFFLGILFVGYYAPAYSIGMLLGFFIFPLASILSVVLPKAFDENNISEVKKYLSYSLKYFLLIIIPATFGLSVLSRQLLMIFSTKEIALNAYFVTPFIATSMFLYGVSYFFNQILILKKKTKLIAIIWAIAAILNFGLNIIFIPIFGILAAAITTLVSYSCGFILTWQFSLKELRFEFDWIFLSKCVIASVLMSAFIAWLNPIGLAKTIIAVMASAIIYGILVLILKAINVKEARFFKELIIPLKNI